ncbi:alkene reductase [Rhodovibrionaceae bacterium A322]
MYDGTPADTTAQTVSPLFNPIKVGDLELKNRIIMAPLTRNRAGDGNVPQDLNATYYQQRASAGLIITEATQVSPYGQGYPATPGMHSPEQVAGWRKVTSAVHQEGGKIFAQLWHVGRISLPEYQPDRGTPVAPSAIASRQEPFSLEGATEYPVPRALELEEIPDIVEAYRQGAEHAKAAGFDGVEIHGANGYLLDQFLKDGSNQRTDRYGGSVENRSRLLLEVVAAASSVFGSGRVGVRISPTGTFNDMSDSDPETLFSYLVEQLNHHHLAYLHVVEDFPGIEGAPFDFSKLKALFSGLYIANGNYDLPKADQAVVDEKADLVAFGRPFIANPDLVARFAQQAPLNEPDPSTFYGGDAKGYTDYPSLSDS